MKVNIIEKTTLYRIPACIMLDRIYELAMNDHDEDAVRGYIYSQGWSSDELERFDKDVSKKYGNLDTADVLAMSQEEYLELVKKYIKTKTHKYEYLK